MTKYVSSSQVVIASFARNKRKKRCKGSFHTPSAFDQSDATSEYELVESGPYSLDQVPLVTIYANKTDTMTSKPPLLDIAHLNLAHYQRQSDLIHSLHIASQPMLVLEGWDDQTKDMAISVKLRDGDPAG